MKQVYLAGPIAGCDFETAANGWRLDAKYFLDNSFEGVRTFSPMRGKDFLRNKGTLGKLGWESNAMSSERGVVGRDRNDVMNADCVLMFLKGADKVSIGTVAEIAWADAFRVPVVLVMEKEGSEELKANPHNHIFVRQMNTYWVDDLDEACILVARLLNLEPKESAVMDTGAEFLTADDQILEPEILTSGDKLDAPVPF